jgi:hypothetical protein
MHLTICKLGKQINKFLAHELKMRRAQANAAKKDPPPLLWKIDLYEKMFVYSTL